MRDFLPTVVIRHKKENLKKCTLRGLEQRSDFLFFSYPLTVSLPSLKNYALLTVDAPELSVLDRNLGLIILDGTWRYVEAMQKTISFPDNMVRFSLPKRVVTAYPRRQNGCPDPERGLASLEALVVAYVLTGRNPRELLERYYWRKSFLEKNIHFFSSL